MNLKRFFDTDVERKSLLSKVRANPSLANALVQCQTDEKVLLTYADKKLSQKTDDFITIQILGEQGSGKSGVGQSLAVRMARAPFTVEHIKLQYAQFLDSVETLERGEFRILDEQTRAHGIGSRRLADDIINIVETLRQNGGSIIIISPTEKMINTRDVYLELTVIARLNDEVLCAWKSRTEEFIGSLIIKLDWNSPLWIDYMTVKQSYVKEAKRRGFKKLDYEKVARDVLTHPEGARATKRAHYRLILEKVAPYLTTEESKLVMAQVEMLK